MEKSKRFSKKREAIYSVLCATDSHPSAETVYNSLKNEFPDISLGTVYRNLAYFKENGSAVTVGVVNGHERYDSNTKTHPHFICDRCGDVIDVHGLCIDKSMNRRAAELYEVDVTYNELVFHGMCKKCKKHTEDYDGGSINEKI